MPERPTTEEQAQWWQIRRALRAKRQAEFIEMQQHPRRYWFLLHVKLALLVIIPLACVALALVLIVRALWY